MIRILASCTALLFASGQTLATPYEGMYTLIESVKAQHEIDHFRFPMPSVSYGPKYLSTPSTCSNNEARLFFAELKWQDSPPKVLIGSQPEYQWTDYRTNQSDFEISEIFSPKERARARNFVAQEIRRMSEQKTVLDVGSMVVIGAVSSLPKTKVGSFIVGLTGGGTVEIAPNRLDEELAKSRKLIGMLHSSDTRAYKLVETQSAHDQNFIVLRYGLVINSTVHPRTDCIIVARPQ